jgi:thiol-disulfide isomerase/thioredoxin
MKGILITADGCGPCDTLKEQFAEFIESGEVVEKNLERDGQEVVDLMAKYGVNLPSLLIVSDSGELIMSV